MKLIAGLDVGTTGCKVTVFTAEGEVLGREYRDYPVCRAADAQEIDAAAIAESVRDAVTAVKSRFGKIEAMGVTSFGEAFVLTDAEGTPLRPVLLCTDARGADECRGFIENFGAARAAGISGVKPSESYSFPKLMWVKAHEPEIYAQACHVMLIEDYVIYLLTGRRIIDRSLAARTGAFDIRRNRGLGDDGGSGRRGVRRFSRRRRGVGEEDGFFSAGCRQARQIYGGLQTL